MTRLKIFHYTLIWYPIKGVLVLLLVSIMCSCSKDNMDGEDSGPGTGFKRIPKVEIGTTGNPIVNEPKVLANMRIIEADSIAYEGSIGIEFRGRSSQFLYPKKSYGIELWDENGEDMDASLLGMPGEEDWILYGPYADKTLIRSKLMYDLSLEMDRYASRSEFVELTIDGVDQGTYVLMEKLKRDKNRIDLSKLELEEISGEDVTGGYILKIDKNGENGEERDYTDRNSFESAIGPMNALTNQKIFFVYEYPKNDEILSEQKKYIQRYVGGFERALNEVDLADTVSGYRAYIDVENFVDFFILNELAHNVDGFRLSTYLQKDKNKKLAMGPIWDFNFGLGNADYCGGGDYNSWAYQFNLRCGDDFWLVPFWWENLLKDEYFKLKLKERWANLRVSTINHNRINSKIDSYLVELNDGFAIKLNNAIWNTIGEYIWPNSFVGPTYDSEVDHLKNWIDHRISWMDLEIGRL